MSQQTQTEDFVTNRRLILQQRPGNEMVGNEHFKLIKDKIDLNNILSGQVLIRVLMLSVDPTQRGWMNETAGYLPPVEIGATMRAIGAGQVVLSKLPEFAKGDLVLGMLGWQDYALFDINSATNLIKLPPNKPLELALTMSSPSGLAAYFGLLDIGQPKEGETVVISAAAGATGSLVGQIAKLKGCKTIGIAGGLDKCQFVVNQLGFDACIDYKQNKITEQLMALAPNGVNIYFDNVGGKILDDVLLCLANKARIVACGSVSTGYGSDKSSTYCIKNYSILTIKRARMEGFIILDYANQYKKAISQLIDWCQTGKIHCLTDIKQGLENAPIALRGLFEGKNVGKQLLKITNAIN